MKHITEEGRKYFSEGKALREANLLGTIKKKAGDWLTGGAKALNKKRRGLTQKAMDSLEARDQKKKAKIAKGSRWKHAVKRNKDGTVTKDREGNEVRDTSKTRASRRALNALGKFGTDAVDTVIKGHEEPFTAAISGDDISTGRQGVGASFGKNKDDDDDGKPKKVPHSKKDDEALAGDEAGGFTKGVGYHNTRRKLHKPHKDPYAS